MTKAQRHKARSQKTVGAAFIARPNLERLRLAKPLRLLLILSSAFSLQTSAFSFDFGSVPATEIICHDFIITNNASAPINISKVRPSCDCLQILSWPRVIPPNDTGAISTRLLPDKIGPVSYRVFVESSDKSEPPRLYVIRGTVIPAPGEGRQYPYLTAVAPELFTRAVVDRDDSCYISACDIIAEDRSQRSEARGQGNVGAALARALPTAFSENRQSAIGNRKSDGPQPALSKAEGPSFTIVDVRSPEAFNTVHIPGALNIPSHLLRTKSFLRSSGVVLVDNFGGDPKLEQTCRDLRSQSFASVDILRGGLNSWRRAGGALEGDPVAVKNISLMSPSDYSKVRDFSDWLVVNVSSNSVRAALLIPEIKSDLRLLTFDLRPSTSILIIDDRGDNYERATAEISGFEDAAVFYLSGGLAGYENYLRLASARPEKHSIQSKPSQPASNQKQSGMGGGLVRRKPCGGCS